MIDNLLAHVPAAHVPGDAATIDALCTLRSNYLVTVLGLALSEEVYRDANGDRFLTEITDAQLAAIIDNTVAALARRSYPACPHCSSPSSIYGPYDPYGLYGAYGHRLGCVARTA